MPTVHIRTYGCQMNVRDSEQVARMFVEGGYTLTDDETEADAILINTCSVRDQAEQKALGKMGMMGRYREHRPHVVFGFIGCMAQSRGEELFDLIPHLDVVVGTRKYHRVFAYVDGILRRRLERRMDDPALSFDGETVCDIADEEDSQNAIRDHLDDIPQASAFVSIMQGCNMRCTFCIVPDTRGRERARPICDIVAEVRSLAETGTREVTLLGQIVNLYGRTELPAAGGRSPFVQLLDAVHEVEGIERIRFASPHPVGFRDDLVEAFARLPKLCSHIHFPLQSGSDRILRAMRRPYTVGKFAEICGKLRAARPDLAVTTDIIVGFPGETDADFRETVQIVERLRFDNAFVFRYSKRKDTPAAELDGQLSERVKEQRNQDLLALVGRIAREKNESFVGTRRQVLVTGPSKTNKSRLAGRTSQNKIVIFDGDAERLTGELIDIDIEETTGFTLYGTVAGRSYQVGTSPSSNFI
jgi:tRNA-2-methylthio-N6-dimethylallyladenosine synthase